MGNNSRGARVLHLFSLFPKQNLPHSYLSCPACCAEWHSSIVAWLQPGTRASLRSRIVAQLQHSRAASSLQPSSSAPRHTCKMACMVAPWKAVLQKSCIVAQLHHGMAAPWQNCTAAQHACPVGAAACFSHAHPPRSPSPGWSSTFAGSPSHFHGDITRNVSFLAGLMCVQTCCYLHTCFSL